MKTNIIASVAILIVLAACNNQAASIKDKPLATKTSDSAKQPITTLDVAAILAKKQVPVLCYHHIRNYKGGESESMKSYSVSPALFAEQMKALHDSGYQTILPIDLYNYLVHGDKLPAKPVMLTYDDTDEEQYSIGFTEMKKYGFKGVYFIMTIAINRPRYMSKEQLKELSDSGNVIAGHTWDHHMVTRYKGADWDTQLVNPKRKLEAITGKPIKYFAYPFGLWNKEAIPELKSSGYDMAFILSTKRDSTEPLYTIRRMIVPGTWSTPGMLRAMRVTFNK